MSLRVEDLLLSMPEAAGRWYGTTSHNAGMSSEHLQSSGKPMNGPTNVTSIFPHAFSLQVD